MKNITFSESSVLREFAKIAHDRGFIKQAQEVPQSKGDIAQQEVPTARHPEKVEVGNLPTLFDDQLNQFPAMKQVYLTGNTQSGDTFLNELLSAEGQKFLTGWYNSPDRTTIPKMHQLVKNALSVVKMLKSLRMNKLQQEHWLPKIEQGTQMLSKLVTKKASVKQAKEDVCYNVTKETGEDLVEKAHPGGGTRTELTHSKTDENLVETIVEQQEKDIEVAKKVPKGTYATLVKLYNDLSKMGHNQYLPELKELIGKIATVDDVVNHTLVSLADQLDGMGYKKAANEVDLLLKKKVAQNPVFEIGTPEFDDNQNFRMDEEVQQPFRMDRALEPEKDELGLVPIPAKKDNKLKQWQVFYNAATRGLLKPLAADGIMGPATRKALKSVQNSGAKTLKEFGEMVRSKSDAYTGQKPMSPPEYPPLPPPAVPPAIDQGRGVYQNMVKKLQDKFPNLNLTAPGSKNLLDAMKYKTRELYTVRDPKELELETNKFVDSLSTSDITKSTY